MQRQSMFDYSQILPIVIKELNIPANADGT
jgi:hypothetical protein